MAKKKLGGKWTIVRQMKYAFGEAARRTATREQNGNCVCKDKTKKKIAEAMVGKKHTEEAKEKIRQSSTGRLHTQETKNKLKQINTGRKITWKHKISETMKGRTYVQIFGLERGKEVAKKIRETHRKRNLGVRKADIRPYKGCFEYKDWRDAVFKRDDYRCQMCNKRQGQRLAAHHKLRWADYPDLRYEVSNGITLCDDPCHKIADKQIGSRVNKRYKKVVKSH